MDFPTLTTKSFSNEAILSEVTAGARFADQIAKMFRTNEPIFNFSFASYDLESLEDSDSKLVEVFRALRDYGYKGIPSELAFDDEAAYHAHVFVSTLNIYAEWYGTPSPRTCSAIVHSVYARAKIDRHFGNEAPGYTEDELFQDIEGQLVPGLTVYQLAILSGVSEQAVKNAMTRGAELMSRIHVPGGRYIEIEQALAWLRTRKGFNEPVESIEGVPLVPAAKDGTVFRPDCITATKGFKTGRKQGPLFFDDFEEACTHLKAL